ncbi:MAG: S1 family peptidase [Candidatus Dormibacteria bacterium]
MIDVDSNANYDSENLCTGWPVGSGYFVTDYHCVYGTAVAPGALGRLVGEGVTVTPLSPSGTVVDGNFNAAVVATDPGHDLALLQVEGINPAAWPNLDRGLPLDLSGVQKGTSLVALDYRDVNQRPFASYGEVTDARLDASPDPAADDYPGEPNDYQDVLEVAATVYPGNSGGPVLNAKGEVVGVVDLGGEGYTTFEAMPIAQVGSEIERWLAR